MRRDPEGYGRIRSIVETTAAERGVNPDAVMEALLGAEGFDSPLIRQLEATPAQYLNRGGALTRTPESLTESGIERVNVYEVPQAQRALPKATSVDSQSSSFRIPLDELDGLVIGTRQKTAMGVDDVTNLNQLRKLGLNDAEASYVLNKANTAPYVFQRGATPSTAAGQTPPRANAMGGVNTVDLGQIFSSPAAAQAAAAGGTEAARRMPVAPFVGGGILGGLGLAAFMSGRQEQLPAPGETQLGVPTATPEFGANTPSVTGAPVASAPQPIAGSTNAIPGTVNPSSLSAPSTPAAPSLPAPVGGRAPSGPVGSSMGAGSVPQLMDSRDSEYRQAVQNAAQGLRQDASQYKNIGDLYSVQSAYANAPGRAEQIVGALKGMGAPASVGIENEANFETWARANPELAYRLQLQMQRRGPSQQMPVAQGAVLGTSMGTNTPNNAAGQARAAAMNAAFGTQGAADLNATLAPQAYQTLEKMPLF
jgi:hypothetical protein